MLRITDISEGEAGVVLKLEGEIIGPWARELEQVYSSYMEERPGRLVLDFSAVRFIDVEGIEVLRRFAPNKVNVTGCSPFIEELLRKTQLEKLLGKEEKEAFLASRKASEHFRAQSATLVNSPAQKTKKS